MTLIIRCFLNKNLVLFNSYNKIHFKSRVGHGISLSRHSNLSEKMKENNGLLPFKHTIPSPKIDSKGTQGR